MADYEVTLGSDVYEFDAFADAIAKAQELGSDAVLTVYALPTEDLYTCGVTTVFDYDGEDTARSIFNGNSASPGVASATITFQHGGIGNLQGTGRGNYGTVTINMEGGYAKYIYGVAYGTNAENVIVNFSGGSTTYIIAGGNSTNVGTATVNITGGRADNVCAGRVVGGTIGLASINMSDGFAGIHTGASMAGKTINGPVEVTVSGGTLNYFYSNFSASEHNAVSLAGGVTHESESPARVQRQEGENEAPPRRRLHREQGTLRRDHGVHARPHRRVRGGTRRGGGGEGAAQEAHDEGRQARLR